jgi:hypothetical protein
MSWSKEVIMKVLILFISLAFSTYAQPANRNTITFSGGLAENAGPSCCGDTAPSLALSYAYRLLPNLDIEAGIDSALALGSKFVSANYDVTADDRFLWVPFGLRGVLPLRHDRVELSAGAGGTYEKYWVGNPSYVTSRDGLGGYGSVGAAAALDAHRHFWLGVSPFFFFANTGGGYSHDRWFVLNVGLGVRF